MSQSSMPKVQLGISLVFWSLELMALVILLVFVVPFVGPKNLAFLLTAMTMLAIGLIVASLMSMLGKIFCLAAPKEMQGKGIIYACVGLDLASLLISLAERVTTMPKLLVQLKGIFTIIGFVLFLIFLRKLAEFIQNSDLAGKAGELLKLGVAFMAFVILAAVSAFKFQIGAIVFGFVAVIAGLIGLVRYSLLLLAMKNVLKAV